MEGLTTITINGVAYPIFFGMPAVEAFTRKVGALETDTILSTKSVVYLVEAGLHNAAFRRAEVCPLSFSDIYDAVEEKLLSEAGQKEINAISIAFAESKIVKHFQAQDEEAKKKLMQLAGTTSEPSL